MTAVEELELPLGGGADGATVRLHPLLTGEIRIPLAYRPPRRGPFKNLRSIAAGAPTWCPVPSFLVQHPSAGPLLIDVGHASSVATHPARTMGFENVRGALRHRLVAPAREQLADRGVDPQRIGLVIATHLHIDHISAAGEWPEATFVTDRVELAAASSPLARTRGYYRPTVRSARWSVVDYEGDAAKPHAGFERTIDLFGDGSVRLVSTPGHSPGHQSVLLRLSDRAALICGDAAISRRQFRDGTVAGLIGASQAECVRSAAAIGRYLGDHPRTLAIPSHDGELWRELERSYE